MVKKSVIKAGAKLLKKAKPKGMLKAKPKGVPTKAGLMARRSVLRGEPMKDPSRLKQTKKEPLIGKFEKGTATCAAETLTAQGLLVTQKKAKAEKARIKKAYLQYQAAEADKIRRGESVKTVMSFEAYKKKMGK